MVPREVHILIPGTWDYVTLQGKGDFATVMMLRIWGLGDNPGRSRWTHCHHRVLYRREAGRSEKELWWQKQKSDRCEPRNTGSFQKLGKANRFCQILLWSLQKKQPG